MLIVDTFPYHDYPARWDRQVTDSGGTVERLVMPIDGFLAFRNDQIEEAIAALGDDISTDDQEALRRDLRRIKLPPWPKAEPSVLTGYLDPNARPLPPREHWWCHRLTNDGKEGLGPDLFKVVSVKQHCEWVKREHERRRRISNGWKR